MKKFNQIYKESKLKLNSMTIAVMIVAAVSFIFLIIAIAVPFSPVPEFINYSGYKELNIYFFSIIPLVIGSVIIAVLYNIRNNRKSFDNIGSTSETYCISNFTSLFLVAITISVIMMIIEIIIVVIAGTIPSLPIVDLDKIRLMEGVGVNFAYYIGGSYVILQMITILFNNIMNRKYSRALLLIAIPVVITIAYALTATFVFGNGRSVEDEQLQKLFNMLSSFNAFLVALVCGVVVSNIVEYVLCVKGDRLR